MADSDPMEFGKGAVESNLVGNPILVIVDGVEANLLDPEAYKKLSQALHEFTRDVLARAHRTAIELSYNKYPFAGIQSAHIENAVSNSILSLAKAITDAKSPK